jgi:hypothetical protein
MILLSFSLPTSIYRCFEFDLYVTLEHTHPGIPTKKIGNLRIIGPSCLLWYTKPSSFLPTSASLTTAGAQRISKNGRLQNFQMTSLLAEKLVGVGGTCCFHMGTRFLGRLSGNETRTGKTVGQSRIDHNPSFPVKDDGKATCLPATTHCNSVQLE